MKTYHLRITGKVQGVWFRASAKDKALSLQLRGKVWNEPDDAVGALVQGQEENVQAFIEWCKVGPPLAKVEEVLVMEDVLDVVFTTFEIAKL